MEQLNKQAPADIPFTTYAFVQNRKYCLTILFLMVGQYILFKQFYPYPDFFSDSYSYISAAAIHLKVNVWPIGYSRFLSIFHFITPSGAALVFFQYFAYAVSALYFYLTVTYFYATGKNTRIILCLFLFFNPMLFFLTNYITGVMLFLSMSICWLAQLLWILNRHRTYLVLTHAVLVFILFTFRNNVMLYLHIVAGVFL